MCPTQRQMEARECDGRCTITPERFKNTILGAAAVVVFFGALSFWLHVIEYTLLGIGVLTVLGVAGYVWVRRVIPARRAQAQQIGAQWQQQVPADWRPPLAQQQQAIPGAVHHHHGHTLALPDNWSPEQIRAFRGDQ